jgi:hypothetical protein
MGLLALLSSNLGLEIWGMATLSYYNLMSPSEARYIHVIMLLLDMIEELFEHTNTEFVFPRYSAGD